VGILGAGKHFH